MTIEPGVPATITDDRTGYRYPATIYNHGRIDTYFEADYAPRPGSTCHIVVGEKEIDPPAGPRASRIEWRRALCEPDSVWSFRLGIKYI